MGYVNTLRSRMKSPSLLSSEGGSSLSTKEPVQVEPKTYFANERTFIQWISAALLLLTVSSIMMGSGNYNATSGFIAFAALILVAYAAFVYFRRVNLLQSGEAYGYLDFLGPSILAAGVGLGVFIVFADAVKGSEFLSTKSAKKDRYDDRRSLMAAIPKTPMWAEAHLQTNVGKDFLKLQEVDGFCTRHLIQGINVLNYEPRDILVQDTTTADSSVMVVTPQSLLSHSFSYEGKDIVSALMSEIPDVEIQSMEMVEGRLWALSTGPTHTELLEFDATAAELRSRIQIQGSTSTSASMVYIPATTNEQGKLYLYLDGTMHTYEISTSEKENVSSVARIGSINMKVLNQGTAESENPIVDMTHFEGVTYLLRETNLEAWDFSTATLLSDTDLPYTTKQGDEWRGLAFERRTEKGSSNLRSGKTSETVVYAHMPLDAFPPQLWTFRVEEETDEGHGLSLLRLPNCGGAETDE